MGQTAKGSGADWYAQAAFPQGRFVSHAGMSSKGTLGWVQGNCAHWDESPLWELEWRSRRLLEPFPRGWFQFAADFPNET